MILYRPYAIVSEEETGMNIIEKYNAQFVTLFPASHCEFWREQEFRQKCKLLFLSDHDVDPNHVTVEVGYKELRFTPLKDIYNRFMIFLKFGW